jgi:hypothetical protein
VRLPTFTARLRQNTRASVKAFFAARMKYAVVSVLIALAFSPQAFAVLRPLFPVKPEPPFSGEAIVIRDDLVRKTNSAVVDARGIDRPTNEARDAAVVKSEQNSAQNLRGYSAGPSTPFDASSSNRSAPPRSNWTGSETQQEDCSEACETTRVPDVTARRKA